MYIVNTTCHKMIILGILVAFYFVLYMHMYVEMIPVFRSIYIVFFPRMHRLVQFPKHCYYYQVRC